MSHNMAVALNDLRELKTFPSTFSIFHLQLLYVKENPARI